MASRAHLDWSALLDKLYTLMQCEALLAAASQLVAHCGSCSPKASALVSVVRCARTGASRLR